MKSKQRRARRKQYDWTEEISKGNINAFYHSTDWRIAREKVLERDKNTCQFFIRKWSDGIHKPDHYKLMKANTVHHIISIKERPDLALDIDNMISLSFEAHEIIEDRSRFKFKKRNKPITNELW